MAEQKPKKKAIEPESLLAEMEEMERWNGATEAKTTENWYELKRKIAQVIAASEAKEENAAE